MFSQTHMPFVSAVASLDLEPHTKLRVVALAVAASVAQCLEIPAVAVNSGGSYFNGQHAQEARRIIGCLNEAAPLATDVAADYARKFWLLRYNVVHREVLDAPVAGDFLSGFTGAANQLTKDDIALLDEHAAAIFKIQKAYCDVKKAEATQ